MRTAIRLFLLICSFFITECCFANVTSWQNDMLDIAIYSKKTTSNKSDILVEFNLKNGWFISWDNPGDVGIPTKFNFNVPVTRLSETTPDIVIHDNILGQYGYFKKAFYLFETNTTDNNVNLEISWEACKQECIKQSTNLNFILNQTNALTYEKALSEAKKTFPADQIIDVNASLEQIDDNTFLNLTFFKNEFDFNTSELYFIPHQKSVVDIMEKATILTSDKHVSVKIKLNVPVIPTQGGILTDKNKAYKLNIIPITNFSDITHLFYILTLAFLGGLILNFMPCVFPVLSLKIISANKNKTNIYGGLMYLSGVITSFLSLAALLYFLRKAGAVIGWGFQLQSPVFVSIMLVLFILILLMLLDIIVISPKLLKTFNNLGNINSFMSGFFAVLIASPCTGPFLGAALGYTLMQSPSIYFITFLCLGLGYALPFTLVEIYPNAFSKIMPKTGKWMLYIKYILSIPIIFTCFWLGWVLFSQLSVSEQQTQHKLFKPYDRTEISKQLNNRKPVFIEFTAKWCLTCLLNEKNVLNTTYFAELSAKHNVILYKADWTENNPEIGQAIKSYGRNSVPLYVYYPANRQQYILLPQILTTGTVKSVFSEN